MSKSTKVVFPIIDRIGAGDAFATGILYGLISKLPLEKIVEKSIFLSVYAQSIYSDHPYINIEELNKFIKQFKKDVSR